MSSHLAGLFVQLSPGYWSGKDYYIYAESHQLVSCDQGLRDHSLIMGGGVVYKMVGGWGKSSFTLTKKKKGGGVVGKF